jgi:hypothetical protein
MVFNCIRESTSSAIQTNDAKVEKILPGTKVPNVVFAEFVKSDSIFFTISFTEELSTKPESCSERLFNNSANSLMYSILMLLIN